MAKAALKFRYIIFDRVFSLQEGADNEDMKLKIRGLGSEGYKVKFYIDKSHNRQEIMKLLQSWKVPYYEVYSSTVTVLPEDSRCFIVASGPSMQEQDISWLKSEMVIGVNISYQITQKYDYIPQYVCWCDPDAYGISYFKDVDTKLVVSRIIKNKGLNNIWKVVPYPLGKVWKDVFSSDIDSGTYWGGTVVIDLAIPLAMYLGYKNIYLLGCDCGSGGYSFKADNRMLSKLGTNDWVNCVFPSYHVVKRFADINRFNIYNAGIGGCLEIFERISFDSLRR